MGTGIFGLNNSIIKHHDLELDAPIYRFMPLKWYDELINEKTIYFHKISKWEDTWEIPCKRLDINLFKNDDMKGFVDAISRENERV